MFQDVKYLYLQRSLKIYFQNIKNATHIIMISQHSLFPFNFYFNLYLNRENISIYNTSKSPTYHSIGLFTKDSGQNKNSM